MFAFVVINGVSERNNDDALSSLSASPSKGKQQKFRFDRGANCGSLSPFAACHNLSTSGGDCPFYGSHRHDRTSSPPSAQLMHFCRTHISLSVCLARRHNLIWQIDCRRCAGAKINPPPVGFAEGFALIWLSIKTLTRLVNYAQVLTGKARIMRGVWILQILMLTPILYENKCAIYNREQYACSACSSASSIHFQNWRNEFNSNSAVLCHIYISEVDELVIIIARYI